MSCGTKTKRCNSNETSSLRNVQKQSFDDVLQKDVLKNVLETLFNKVAGLFYRRPPDGFL